MCKYYVRLNAGNFTFDISDMANFIAYKSINILVSKSIKPYRLGSFLFGEKRFGIENQQCFLMSSVTDKEEMDELKNNPYYAKYADKIAKLQKTSPEEFLSKLEATEKPKQSNPAKEVGKDFSLPTKPKPEVTESKASLLAKEKTLDSIMKLDLLREKTKDEISEIWKLHHASLDAVCAVIPADVWEEMRERFTKHKTFLFPLPRKDGYEFMVVQFLGKSAHFTTLINFQAYQENAPECLTLDHYTELIEHKKIVLMVGRYDTNMLTIQEAQCLANQVEMYYCAPSEEKRALLDTFTNSPNNFKHADLINQLEKIDLLAAIPKKN